jgi:phosphoribosylaminoimidazole-succinocarboxamide synthase
LSTNPIVLETHIPALKLERRGKVRDVYSLGATLGADFNDRLLFIATDRISAFDCILASGIPDKGRILTQISLFWFDWLNPIVANHVVTADISLYPSVLQPFADQLSGRSMIVKRAEMITVECVARGYLDGSGWKDYQRNGKVCGIELPKGLKQGDQLPEPIFTPASKAESGHDENISFAEVVNRVGNQQAVQLRDLTLRIYREAAKYARSCGIILADCKFEFGMTPQGILLADEVFTPDSSRFWAAESWKPGGPQTSFDKQFVRDYLESIKWNKQPPAPALPEDVAARTRAKYLEAFRLLTGKELEE